MLSNAFTISRFRFQLLPSSTRLVCLPWLVTAALLVLMFAASPNFRASQRVLESPFGGDFLQEWIGGWIVRHGDYDKFYDRDYAQSLEHDTNLTGIRFRQESYFPLVYPPFYYLLVSPLSGLPFRLAAVIWLGAMVLALLAAWWCLQQVRGSTSLDPWCLPLALLFTPLIESLTSCQKGTVLLCLFAATFVLLQRGRPFFAGLVFGLVAFKPQFALPLALLMLWKREWWFVVGGSLTGCLLVGCCLCMGTDVCWQYVEFSRHAQQYLSNAGYDLAKSHAWNGFWHLLLGKEASAGARSACVWGAGVSTVSWLLWSWRGSLRYDSTEFAMRFTQIILATLLLSPHLYTYDLTLLLLPMYLLGVHHKPASNSQHIWGVALFCLAGLSPKIAVFTGVQLTVPLMACWLLSCGSSRVSTSAPIACAR